MRDGYGVVSYRMTVKCFPDDVFAGYLAGFLDGEGYIQGSGDGVRIVLANCEVHILEEIRDRLGFGAIRSQQQKAHWRERFTLVFFNGEDVEAVLRLTRPYLRIKGQAADAALAKIDAWRENVRLRQERNAGILEAIKAGEVQKSIAARFGVSTQTVSRIKRGHLWPSEKRSSGSKGFAGLVKA